MNNMSYTETHTGKLIPIKTISCHQEFINFVHENDLIRDEINLQQKANTRFS